MTGWNISIYREFEKMDNGCPGTGYLAKSK